MSFIAELRRRNVLRVGAAYIVSAWLIVQVVETIFPAFGFGDAAIRIAVIVLAIGLLLVLILAWVFEWTPEGLRKESEIDRSESITLQTGKKLDRMIMVVLALALGYFAFDKFVLDPARDESQILTAREEGRTAALVDRYGDKSIAVLAFADMSPEKDQEYMSDGIAEELLNLLTKVDGLRVISRSSAFVFKGQNMEIREIAQRLNVVHILEGSVRKAGDQIRITAQLVDARSDTHLWSETYDRTMEDIFAIQDEIAAEVVTKLKVTLLGEMPTVREMNPQAYAIYLQANYLGTQLNREGTDKAAELYQQILAMNPGNASAWSGLAWVYINQAAKNMRPRDEGYRMAREAAERALVLNPNHAGAYSALASYAEDYDGDLAAAAGYYKSALSVSPNNPGLLGNVALLLGGMGRLDDAIALSEYTVSRDPLSPIMQSNHGLLYYWAERFPDAVATLRSVEAISPDYFAIKYRIGESLLLAGRPEEALDEMEAEIFEPYRLVGLALVRHALGQAEEADATLAELIEKYEELGAYNIAYVMAFRGEIEKAFHYLDFEYELSGAGVFREIVGDPLFDNLRQDPRWIRLLEKVGRSPEQLAAIKLDVRVPH